MSFIAELKQALYDLPLARKPGRDEVAHFCEHHGIRRRFIRARTTWKAITPSAVKPWWMILDPMKYKTQNKSNVTNKSVHNKNIVNEVFDNA